MGRMFMNCNYLTSIDVSHFDTNNVTNMQNMFFNCYRLTDIDLSKFNTSLVTNMRAMFQDCMSITSMDLSSFNTANVNDMRSMFSGCDGLTSLDLTSFNTANVTRTGSMFSYSNALTTIYVGSGWSTAAVTSSSDMFFNCTSLVGGQGTTYDANHIDKAYAHIDGGTSNPGYFTDKNASLRGDVNGDGNVNTADVSALINLLLTGGTPTGGADANQDGNVNTSDVAALIKYLLSGTW
jgi:surface protein